MQGGVATDNNILTAVGLTLVAIPALISGGMAIAAGIGGATLAGIMGGATLIAGIRSALFASAEYQKAATGQNWMINAGLSEEAYNGLLITTAVLATIGTFASLFCYNFNIKSINKIGKIKGVRAGKGYPGIRFTDKTGAIRSIELHPAHQGHG